MKKHLASILGNILEHYDQALYGFLAPLLAPLFFPNVDPIYALIYAYALLPLALIAKPLGAFFFGWLGDRIGRARTTSITLLGMAIATTAMGCLPVHQSIGWLAPLLLVIGRLLQYFFASGARTGGALLLLEQTEKRKRGWMSSLFDASSILGILLASFAVWGWGAHWRVLFWIGACSALAGWILRRRIPSEPPIHQKTNWKDLCREWRALISISLVIGYSYGNYYMVTHFLNGFLPLISRVGSLEALGSNTLLLFLDLFLLPFFGWLTLRMNKERLMRVALLSGIVFTLPFFLLLDGATLGMVIGVRVALVLIGVCFSAPYHAWAMDRCPPHMRFTLCAMGFAIGSQLIGAPMPAFSFWLYHQTGWVGSAALPVIGAALLAQWAFLKNRPAIAKLRSVN